MLNHVSSPYVNVLLVPTHATEGRNVVWPLVYVANLIIKVSLGAAPKWPDWRGARISETDFLHFIATKIIRDYPRVTIIARWLY